MSNKTFNMSTEQVEGTFSMAHKDLLVDLSPENHYSTLSLSPSPDSNTSDFNLSDREANSSPDINMLECCLSDSSTMDNPYDTTVPQANTFCDPSANLNQTFVATPVNGSVNFWNENLSRISDIGMSLEKTFNQHTVDGCDSTVMSPDSAGRESRLGSCDTSRRGSTENDCCSLSSGEMLVRSNSFCIEDQSLSLVSSLDESSVSQVASNSTIPGDTNLQSATLPDVCEKSSQSITKGDQGHPCLGMTFTQVDLPTEENGSSTPNSFIALPGENEGGFFKTFVCEKSPSDCKKETDVKAEILLFPGALIPGLEKTSVSTLSLMPDIDKDVKTSTPVQTMGNNVPCLPSFSESPCSSNSVTPGLRPLKQQKISGTPHQPLAAVLNSANKVKKREIKKFPKTDFSNIKSKVVTRNVHQMSVPGNASQQQQSQENVNNKPAESHRGAAIRISPAKERSRSAFVSTKAKAASDALRQVNTGAANLGTTVIHLSGSALDGQGKSKALASYNLPSTNAIPSTVECSNVLSETEKAASSQLADTTAEHVGNQTFCFSSSEKSPDRSGQTVPKPTPKKVVPKIEVRSGSASGQDNPHGVKTRPRCSSESSSLGSWPLREKKTTIRFSTSLTIPKTDNKPSLNAGSMNCSIQNKRVAQAETSKRLAEHSRRDVKKISLVVEPSKSTAAGASSDDIKSRFRLKPSPRQSRGAPSSRPRPPAASPRPSALSTRQRQETLGRDESKTSKAIEMAHLKLKSSTGSHRVLTTGGPSFGTATTATIKKTQLNGSQTPQTPSRSSLMGPPPTSASRLPRKTLGSSRSVEANFYSELTEGAQVSGGATRKQTPFRTAVLKTRLTTSPGRNTRPALTTAGKPVTPVSKGSSNSTVSPLKKTASAKLRLTSSGPVDKSKPKAGSRPQQPQQTTSQPNQSNGRPDVVPASVAEGGTEDKSSQKLQGLLAASDRRFEALAIVLQQTLAEREEATRHCRELSQELVSVRGELVSSVHSSELLQKEKDELAHALEEALQKVQEQHQKDMAELEQKLQSFYQDEWEKVHLTYQEEADKCKTLMQEQMGELKANHESMKQELENNHTEQLQCVKQQYEMSLEELSKIHSQELQSLEKSLKDAEDVLSRKIEELTVENNALIEKLTAEEERRKELSGKCQKDSHTLYLEQELESLKVVLDIKNKQLHQQEKKLMEVDKLKEKTVKLDESLQRLQQENEDLKARMDRHAALSRQLSTEQAVLQESLQKESKVNKRLSMENEELLWKLHNGDLSSPRKVSPTSSSPSHTFSLQSPRNSGLFSSPPVSPR